MRSKNFLRKGGDSVSSDNKYDEAEKGFEEDTNADINLSEFKKEFFELCKKHNLTVGQIMGIGSTCLHPIDQYSWIPELKINYDF